MHSLRILGAQQYVRTAAPARSLFRGQANVTSLLGEVVGIHIDERLLKDGIYDTANAQHVLRAGGPADYFSIGPEQLFKVYRPESWQGTATKK